MQAKARRVAGIAALVLVGVVALAIWPLLAVAAMQTYTFEDGTTQGWAQQAANSAIINDNTTNVTNSTAQNHTPGGSHSLEADTTIVSGGTQPTTAGYASVAASQLTGVLTAYVYAPSSISVNAFVTNSAQFYIVDNTGAVTFGPVTNITNGGTWTQVTWDPNVRAFPAGPYQSVGITFTESYTSGVGTTVQTYVDDVTISVPNPTSTPTQAPTATVTATGTTTATTSWVQQQSPTSNTLFAVAINPSGGAAAVGSSGTIVYTLDDTNWLSASSGVPSTIALRAVAFTSVTHGVAVGDAGEYAVTNDGGQTWSPAVVPTVSAGPNQSDLPFLNSISFVSPSVGFAGGYFAAGSSGGPSGNPMALMETTDGGVTWSYVNPPSGSGLMAISFTSSRTGYIATDLGTILMTTDGGQTWTTVDTVTGFDIQWNTIAANGNTVVAGGLEGVYARSASGGVAGSWTNTHVGNVINDTFGALAFADSSTIFGARWGGDIVESTDDGQTWTALSLGGNTNSLYGLAVSSPTHGYAVGGTGVIFALGAGPSGATLTVSGNSSTTSVSAPLVSGTVSFTLTGVSSGGSLSVTTATTPPTQGTPSAYRVLGTNYQVANSGVTFSTAKACFPYTPAEVAAAGLTESSLRIFHYQGGVWVDVTDGAPDTANHVICGDVASFSPFIVGAKATHHIYLPFVTRN